MSEPTKSPTVDVNTLAKLFNLTTVWIQKLAEKKIIVKAGRGQYELWPSIKGYITHLQTRKTNQHDGSNTEDGQNYEAHRARLTRAKADIAEIDAELKKGTTHDAQAVAAVWADMIGNARAKLLGLPTKLAGALDGLTITERESLIKEGVNEALRELADYSPEVVTGEWERRRQPMQDEDAEDDEAEDEADE
jgi:phage terminase Nu1 subunit (DNA packaging protein)